MVFQKLAKKSCSTNNWNRNRPSIGVDKGRQVEHDNCMVMLLCFGSGFHGKSVTRSSLKRRAPADHEELIGSRRLEYEVPAPLMLGAREDPWRAGGFADPSAFVRSTTHRLLHDEPSLVWRAGDDRHVLPAALAARRDELNPPKRPPHPTARTGAGAQQVRRSAGIVHVRRRHANGEQPPVRIDEDMAFQTHEFLAAVVSLRPSALSS